MIGPDDRVGRRSEALFTRIDDDLLGIDTQEGLVYTLNGSARRVWELIETETTVSAVCEQLQSEFEVEPATCLADVGELLGRLQDSGLVAVETPLQTRGSTS